MTISLDPLKTAILLAAALRGPFNPRDLLREMLSPSDYKNKVLRARLLSLLHGHCTVEPAGSDGSAQWLLRATTRERALAEFDGEEISVATDITSALAGVGAFSPSSLDQLIDTSTDEDALNDLIVTLERAGQKAPGHDRLIALRSRLSLLVRTRKNNAALAEGFIGRTFEIETIEQWIDTPQTNPPLRSLHIVGIPGIGKSYLLERVAQIAHARDGLIMVRLDFDRSALRVGQDGTLYDEISRQIGDALPRHAAGLREHRLRYSERVTQMGRDATDLTPRELLQGMINATANAGKQLIFLLDSLEFLQAQGATYAQVLMEDLDRFADQGKIGVTVISAGQEALFTSDDRRYGGLLHLTKIEPVLIREILRQEGVAERIWHQLEHEADGDPLKLRLLISAAKAMGEVQTNEAPVPAPRTNQSGDFIDRILRDRLPEHLHPLVDAGFVLEALTPDRVSIILAPALGLPELQKDAEGLIRELAHENWLVKTEDTGRLTPRPDIRQKFLDHIYSDSAADAAAINRAACRYFAGRNPILHLYHAAQLMRAGAPPPQVETDVADRFPDERLKELPIEAQDLIRHARGERSSTKSLSFNVAQERGYDAAGLAGAQERTQPKLVCMDPRSATGRAKIVDGRGFAGKADPRALSDLRAMLEQGERREALHILHQGLPGQYAHASEIGVLILCYQWLTGHWSKARELFALLPDEALSKLAKENPQLEGRITLEIFAEFEFAKLVQWLENPAFRACAVNVMQNSSRVGLRGAALDFALLAAGVTVDGKVGSSGVLAPYVQKQGRDSAQLHLRKAASLRADFGLHMAPPDLYEDAADTGRYALAVAPINPYYDRLFALVLQIQATGTGRLLTDLREFSGSIAEAAALFAPNQIGVDKAVAQAGERPLDILALIRALGLAADWAEGYSFYHPIPDLPTLARALSRWHHTTAGYWAYDSPPPAGWSTPDEPSGITQMRISALSGLDSNDVAKRMLSIWTNSQKDSQAKASATLARRLSKPFAQVTAIDSTFGRMAFLSSSRVPPVFHPAFATLPDHGAAPAYFL